jgi:hypothetical protein
MTLTSISKMKGVAARRDPNQERIELMHGLDNERLSKVAAVATGELRRMCGLTLDRDGRIDPLKLNAALAGQSIERRMRLKGMLAEIGAIPA